MMWERRNLWCKGCPYFFPFFIPFILSQFCPSPPLPHPQPPHLLAGEHRDIKSLEKTHISRESYHRRGPCAPKRKIIGRILILRTFFCHFTQRTDPVVQNCMRTQESKTLKHTFLARGNKKRNTQRQNIREVPERRELGRGNA